MKKEKYEGRYIFLLFRIWFKWIQSNTHSLNASFSYFVHQPIMIFKLSVSGVIESL